MIDANPPRILPPLALVLAMLSIACGASFAKSLFPEVGAEGATALRLSIGALLLVPILRPWRVSFRSNAWQPVVIYGLMLGGMNVFFYLSIQTLPLGVALAIEFTGPLAVAIAASRRSIDFLWIGLAMIGLVLLLPLRSMNANLDPIGIAFALCAGACWAAYIIYGGIAGRLYGISAASIGLIVASAAMLPIGIAKAGFSLFTPSVLALGLLVAILSSAIPYTLEMFALRHLPRKTFGTLTSAEPAVAALVGLALLHEALPVLQWIGIISISLASVGAALTAMQE
ncbi:EamA family transporter [Phyllobacterium leguminum]|uniref:EamA family transporter n=1 Tax=Phyllobacterium leguminum TaxID=314237 RepID=UPI001FDFCC55|nr:EamA family transporter [Phyllobacterium leguminum]